jgi:hypothetical protein
MAVPQIIVTRMVFVDPIASNRTGPSYDLDRTFRHNHPDAFGHALNVKLRADGFDASVPREHPKGLL